MKNTFCGTLDYVSPEVLEEKQYSLDVDLWSLGILIFELLTGFPPFQ
jgi:serine/threonine protein kinase